MFYFYPESIDNHCIPVVYKFFTDPSNAYSEKSNDDEFNQSLDEYVEWHKQLECKLLSDHFNIYKRQETKALLFSSTINVEKLYFMKYLLLCPDVEKALPVLIFNYITNITENNYKKLNDIKKKTIKDKYDPHEFIDEILCHDKQPRYLKSPTRFNESMNKIYQNDLILKIKFSFIHITSFLKIMGLPICKNSDKLACILWYFSKFPDNANAFFSDEEKAILHVSEYDDEEFDCEESEEEYNHSLKYLFQIIGYIENVNKIDSIITKANVIEAYIKKNNPASYLPEGSYSLSSKYDYFCGKYLYKLMIDNDRAYDFFKLFDVNASATEAGIGNIEEDKIIKYLTIKNAEFKFKDIQFMEVANKLVRTDYYPLHTIVFQDYDSYYMQGCISDLVGNIEIDSNNIECTIPQLRNLDDQYIYIKELQLTITNFSKFKSSEWAIYILAYYIIFKGFKEIYPSYSTPENINNNDGSENSVEIPTNVLENIESINDIVNDLYNLTQETESN